MHAVIETEGYLSDAKKAGVAEDELTHIASKIAQAPLTGDIIPGTGGARKLRFASPRKGKGKRGGYRVITYYAASDVPVFMLALINKGQRADISQAERNALRDELAEIEADYRLGVRLKVKHLRGGRND
ncbi:MAG: type II toxin-antitoxin system RelE/ParE family toxin [Hyphomicrobiales bacterium]|nr:type II toxin-antitoxin system RelE/ParE family toxin [Hyphomicrobiales bacterium]